jgi:hypothetical protein
MAGVSGPCPYCASEITSLMPHEVPSEHLAAIQAEEQWAAQAAPTAAPDDQVPWRSEEFDSASFSEAPATQASATTLERTAPPQQRAPGKLGKKQRKVEKNDQRRSRREQEQRREEGSPLPRKPSNATSPVSGGPTGMSLFSKVCLAVAGVALVAIGAVFGLPEIMGDQDTPEEPPGFSVDYDPDHPTPSAPNDPATRTPTATLGESRQDPQLGSTDPNDPSSNPSPNQGIGFSDDPNVPHEAPALPNSPAVGIGEPSGSGVNPSMPKELTEYTPPADSILVAPRRALENFLMAENWEKRMQYCIGGQSLAKTLKSYYTRYPGGQMKPIEITYAHHETDPDGVTQFFLFTVLFEVDQNGEPVPLEFPVVVEQSKGKWLVEWETFSEFKDHHLQTFVQKRPMNKPKAFHVVMTRDHFFGSDPELQGKVNGEQYLCVRVQSPNPEEGSVAFLNVATSAGEALKDALSWERTNDGIPATPYVELTWKESSSKTPYLEVTKLLADKWRTPKSKGN